MKNLKYLLLGFGIIMMFSNFTTTGVTIKSKLWSKLGSKTVNYRLDKDVIKVGVRDGSFRKIQLKVTGGSLNLHNILVEYGNGEKEKINVCHNFRKGSVSRIIDLKGNNRIIKDITFWYDTKNISRTKSKMTVYGLR